MVVFAIIVNIWYAQFNKSLKSSIEEEFRAKTWYQQKYLKALEAAEDWEIGQDEITTLLTTDVPKSQMSHQIVAEETTCEDINVESEDLLSTIRLGAHVYFLKDGASWIDTNMVIRQSARGCDASNIYDEELPQEDIEHSDD